MADDFALSLSSRSTALGELGKHREALVDCRKAAAIFTHLVEEEGRNDLAPKRALLLGYWRELLRRQRQQEQAPSDFKKGGVLMH